jgi:hypothetical protein
MNEYQPQVPSSFQVHRIGRTDADLGKLVLFKPRSTERVTAPPPLALGIITDGIGGSNDAPVRGMMWLGGAFEFVSLEEIEILAAVEAIWHIKPILGRATYRASKPGDLIVTKTEGMGLVHAAMGRGQLGLLSLSAGTATICRADQMAIVMPWRLLVDSEIVFESP